jgi:hypothetical protein
MTNEFIELLRERCLITDETCSKLKEESTKINLLPTQLRSRLKRLRILSINPTNAESMVLFIAIDDTRKVFYGDIRCDIVENPTPGTVIECDPSIIDHRHDGRVYASIGEDDNVRILNTGLPLPTFSDVKCNIGDITSNDPFDFTNRGRLYFLEGFVIGQPEKIESYMHGISANAVDLNIAGGGGQIRLIGPIIDETTISEGDHIRIVGAIAIPNVEYIDDAIAIHPSGWRDIGTEEIVDVELRLSPYGSVVRLERKTPY